MKRLYSYIRLLKADKKTDNEIILSKLRLSSIIIKSHQFFEWFHLAVEPQYTLSQLKKQKGDEKFEKIYLFPFSLVLNLPVAGLNEAGAVITGGWTALC